MASHVEFLGDPVEKQNPTKLFGRSPVCPNWPWIATRKTSRITKLKRPGFCTKVVGDLDYPHGQEDGVIKHRALEL